MTNSRKNTALLLFVNKPKDEIKYKSLITKDLEANRQLFTFLNNKLTKTASACELPNFIIDSDIQSGDSFGEKLANAFEHVFNKGFENVIALGNDCLTLSSKEISYAAEILYENSNVLGPTANGGAYLIGLNKSSFDKNAFVELNWQSKHLFDELKEFLASTGTVGVIKTQLDTNNAFEFIAQIKQSLSRSLKNIIRRIIGRFQHHHPATNDLFNKHFFSLHLGKRGPPIFD